MINEVQKPKQVAIMHCKAHQGGTSKISEGNRLADRAARQIARKVWNVMALVPLKVGPTRLNLPKEARYSFIKVRVHKGVQKDLE